MSINGTELTAAEILALALPKPATTRSFSISMTDEQWNELYRRHKLHEKMCEIGMTSPGLNDLVMFQIFKQISNLQKPNQ